MNVATRASGTTLSLRQEGAQDPSRLDAFSDTTSCSATYGSESKPRAGQSRAGPVVREHRPREILARHRIGSGREGHRSPEDRPAIAFLSCRHLALLQTTTV